MTGKLTKVGHVAKDRIMSPPTLYIIAVEKMNERQSELAKIYHTCFIVYSSH